MTPAQLTSCLRRAAAAASLFAFLLAVPALHARFTLEQVMSSPFPSGLTAAGRSPRVAWVFDAKGVRNIWVADAPDFAARQVTHYSGDDGMPLSSVRLTPDGRTVVFVRGSESNKQGEVADPASNVKQPHQEVWAVDVEKGQPRLLGTVECNEEDCEDLQISPDGERAVWAGAKGQLWIVPISGAEKARQLTYVRGDNNSPRWSRRS
jgi:Tol biopolymer transport system component